MVGSWSVWWHGIVFWQSESKLTQRVVFLPSLVFLLLVLWWFA